jgi:DNA-3-methyladenine glycosylase
VRALDPDAARAILAGPTLEAARRLIGASLIREGSARRVVRIVEVEAYVGMADQASHARFGRTARNEVMFGPPGMAYVYLVYGMYHCLNVVTEPAGAPAAVLIRAAESEAGIDAMRAARAAHRPGRAARDADRAPRGPVDGRIASGPGVLCAAMSIDRSDSGHDLVDLGGPLRLEIPAVPLADNRVGASARVGIGYAPEPWQSVPWRFFDLASPSVSGRRAGSRS